MTTRQRRDGATLIEMIVVIALIGLMASVVTPSMVSADRSARGQSGPDGVAAVLRLARARAIDQARRVDLTIDPVTGRFWLTFPDSTGVIALPEGTTLFSRARRVHAQFESTGAAVVDDALFIRRAETTIGVGFDR